MTESPPDEPSSGRGTGARWLLLIAVCALVVRAAWLWQHGAVIENEGAAYARLAENLIAGRGYADVLGGRNTVFPPLYPMAIALVAALVGNAELAARLLSYASGVLVLWPVYGIARYLGGPRSALIAAMLAAGSGMLIALSGSTYSESTYFLLVMCGIYSSCRVLDGGALRHAIAAGLFFGSAYLIRPEALAYAALVAAFLAGQALATRRPWRQTSAVIAAIGASVILLAAPYVAWLSLNSGYFRWEGKTLINGIISNGISQGMTYSEAARGLGPNLERLGPYLTADQFQIVAADGTGTDLAVSALLTNSLPRLVDVAKEFLTDWSVGGPALVLFAILGLLASLLDKGHRVQKLFFAAAGASYLVVLMSLQFRTDRYLFPLALMALPWTAAGISMVADKMARLSARSKATARRSRLVFAGTAIVAIALSAIPGLRFIGDSGEFSQSTSYELKLAGLWLRDRDAGTVMGYSSVVPYYAGATLLYLPWAPEDTALKYIHAVRPDFVYLRDGDEQQAPYLERWLAEGIPDRCAVPRRAFPEAVGGQLTVFEWQCK